MNSGRSGRGGIWFTSALALAPGCAEHRGGCSPQVMGREGGGIGIADGDCTALMTVQSDALDKEYQVDVECDEADYAPIPACELSSLLYLFSPPDVRMFRLAELRLRYDGGAEPMVGWSVSGEQTDWSLLDVPVTPITSYGQPAVSFEYDRFGYFAVFDCE